MADDIAARPTRGQRTESTTEGRLNGAAAEAQPGQRLGIKQLTDEVASLMANGSHEAPREQPKREQQEQGEEVQRPRPVPRIEEDESGEERDEGDQGDEAGEHKQGVEDEGESGDVRASIDDLGKAVGLSRAELNAVEVRVGPETMTLGELKAKLPEVARLQGERLEFEQRKEMTELEQIDAHRRVLAIVDAIPRESLPPALVHRVEAQHRETREREAELLVKARPQWRDPKYSASEKEAMVKIANRYGFSNAELASIMDHRQVLLLQDFAHTLARIDTAKQTARKVEPGSDKPLSHETTRAATDSHDRPRGVSKKAHVAERIRHLIERG